jgi:methionyl-tRNA formyltransferase
MKILVLCGSHPRHLYVASKISQFGYETSQIRMKRESFIMIPPPKISKGDKKNFIRHFTDRAITEEKEFTTNQTNQIRDSTSFIELSSEELNSNLAMKFVQEFKPNLCIIFGTELIREPLLSVLPSNTFNLHLGLSPWYRGAATLFWPFYLLEPQFAGITIHKINDKPDAGEIFHQVVPRLVPGQGIHDVAAEAVKAAINPLQDLLALLENNPSLDGIEPSSSGRIWRDKDFRPEHLRVIYDDYNNEIVDRYLEGKLGNHLPKLYSVL